MIIGGLLKIKFEDINNDVIFIFVCSIIELIVLIIGFCYVFIEISKIDGTFLLGVLLLIGFTAFLCYVYFKNIQAGIFVIRNLTNKKLLNNANDCIIVEINQIKKEAHYATKFEKARYYRYYFVCTWVGADGRHNKVRSFYYNKQSADYFALYKMKVYFNEKVENGYLVVPDI